MRRRSNTIAADSFDEFIDLSISQSPAAYDASSYIESHYCYLASNYEFSHEPLLYSDSSDQAFSQLDKPFVLSPDRKDASNDQEGDFYSTSPPNLEDESTSLSTQADSWLSSNNSSLSKLSNSDLKAKLDKQSEENPSGSLYKIMLIGSTGTGRHTIINSLFNDNSEQQKKEEPKLRNAMDLLIRSKKDQGQTRRFKFWIRDPNCQRFDPLVRVYYRSINYYIFIYKTNDSNSLECAEKAIQEVMAEVPRDRFKGLLLANTLNGQEEREVTREDGENIKRKYGLERFAEVDDLKSEVEKINQELTELLGVQMCVKKKLCKLMWWNSDEFIWELRSSKLLLED